MLRASATTASAAFGATSASSDPVRVTTGTSWPVAAAIAAVGTESLVLVIEDVHWADRATLALLRHLVRHLTDARCDGDLLRGAAARDVAGAGQVGGLRIKAAFVGDDGGDERWRRAVLCRRDPKGREERRDLLRADRLAVEIALAAAQQRARPAGSAPPR